MKQPRCTCGAMKKERIWSIWCASHLLMTAKEAIYWVMPYPLIPDSMFVEQEACPGMSSKRCDYFLFTDYETKVHIYLDSASGAPVKLIHEVEVDKQDVPMLTYDYKDVVLGAPAQSLFEVASLGKQAEECDLHAGGFPYIHVFHYFVKL